MEGDVHLEVDPNVKPVQMPLRRLPVAIRDSIESELKLLVKDGVIASVTEPTPWVSALLAVTKPNGQGVRICIDPTPLNRALIRSTHYIPSLDDVLPRLADVKVFSTMDIKKCILAFKIGSRIEPIDHISDAIWTLQMVTSRFWFERCTGSLDFSDSGVGL
jgi:hypothetical protein